MTTLLRDIRFGYRLLLKSPGFTLVALLALSIGIGANTAIYSIVYATLISPLPYRHPGRLVLVWSKVKGSKNVVSAGDYLDWKRENGVFQSVAAWTGAALNVSRGSRPESVPAERVTPGYFSTLGENLILGRNFLPDEGEVGKDHVAILDYSFWKAHFEGDREIIGKPIQINGQPYTVVGVLAPGPFDRSPTRLFVPLAFQPKQINHDFHWLLVLGRLKPGVTLAQANANMKLVTRHIAQVHPQSNRGWGAIVEPYRNAFLNRDTIRVLWLLLGAVGFVLLIACGNVANLSLARGTTRQKEVALRVSVGASRLLLLRQFLVESLALALLGCVCGVLLGWALLRLIVDMMPSYALPSSTDIRLNLPVLLFALGISLAAGVLFGCAPAWQATHINLNEALKEEGRGSLAPGRHGLRQSLVVVEFALALTLLAGGGLAIHSLWNVAHVKRGFRADHVLTFRLPVANGRLATPKQVVSFYRQILNRVQALPGVSSVSASEGMPMQGAYFGMPFQIAGKQNPGMSQSPTAEFNMVTPEYFQVFGIHMIRGRPFTDQDQLGSNRVAIVNEAFVKKFLSGVDPLSQSVLVQQLIPGVTQLGHPISWQIVGVYPNVRNGGPRNDFPEIDVPFWQSPWPQTSIEVRATVDPASLTRSIAKIVQSVDPNLPMAGVRTMNQIVDEFSSGDRFEAFLFGGFAAIALILAALGIYGVMSFAVAQRTHEMALRVALGAETGRIVALVLREGIVLAGIGLLVGIGGAYFVGRAMQSVFYEVGVIDPIAFGAAALLLVFFALLACYIPALRAAGVDPMLALKQ